MKISAHWVVALVLLVGSFNVPLAQDRASEPAPVMEKNVATPLDQRVAIYVPSTTQVSKAAESLGEKMTEETLVRFSTLFGGATAQKATGAYIAKEGLVKEQIKIVYSFTDERTLQAKLTDVLALAKSICERMDQECVCVEVNGRLYLVDRQTKRLAPAS